MKACRYYFTLASGIFQESLKLYTPFFLLIIIYIGISFVTVPVGVSKLRIKTKKSCEKILRKNPCYFFLVMLSYVTGTYYHSMDTMVNVLTCSDILISFSLPLVYVWFIRTGINMLINYRYVSSSSGNFLYLTPQLMSGKLTTSIFQLSLQSKNDGS